MAKKVWDAPIDKNIPWDGSNETDNLPVSGKSVETFLKDTLNEKIGVLHYDVTNNRYLAFADQQSLDEYLADPTLTDLVLGTFDAPFNYSAEITLTTPSYNAVFYGSTGNYIDFTFDVKNKQGASTGENVTVTYTFIRNATKKVFTETRRFGEAVHFNVDKYLGEGTNTVIVGVTGQTTLAATTVALSYQVVNLTIEDDIDVSTMYDLRGGAQVLEVGYTVSGYGTKVVEWYLDGVQLEYVKAEDEVVDVTATRTKYLLLSNLSQGTHSLQIRAYTTINGEKFYTNTLYRDIIVYTGLNSDLIIAMAATIPVAHGILDAGESLALYDAVQYIPYTLRFGTYTATNASSTDVHIYIDGELQGTVGAKNGVENEFTVVTKTAGNKSLSLQSGDIRYDLAMVVSQTTMNLQEITQGLVLDFTALGKSNSTPDRDTWSGNGYTGTLTGFNWNSTSGWVNNRLEMSAGTTFALNLAPLAGNPTSTGRTIEIEWSTKNVTDDDEVICDLRDGNVGILITATKVSMTSADGVTVETEYKSDENVRVGFVINRASGTTNQRMSFIYANGIVSRGEKWASTDSYSSLKEIVFNATDKAQVSLKSIRVYNVALTADQMLNNFTLYRDTVADMMTVYDRNDVYEEGTTTFSPDKMMSRLPVMIVTGDIPTLENTSDKDTQIAVTIDYYNMQDASKSFRMVGAAMRPQGTSSMGYPKKNFRIYTRKLDGTILYDANGNIVEDKLYSFKDGAQPVDCWCLKADYAESSGTHNTGIARLWNEALMNAQVSITLGENNPHNVDSEYVLRTEAQKAALAAGYPYDVRTTIDGFPILLFYRPSMNDDVIFIGKYNFNNDKSTESVFGFTGIPNFDNSHMQCWEVLNNGNALALFTSTDGFDSGWSEAFESRYPDTKNPNTADLKAFCEWMVNVSEEDFSEQKWEHLDVFKMAAYWCYLMRHAGADQFVKNAMFTSEDGVKFYYILYDNDTINGLINTGRLRIKPTDDRQTVDATGSYVFAGHDSRLWNMLEADTEFMQIVSAVDNALYSAGISYANTIKIFDEEQADKWVERVYNQDAQYKYVGPYIEKGIDNLFMLQGKRDIHRRWWLAKRFSIYDAKFVSGTYKSQAFEFKCINGTPAGQQFSITAGYPLDYGYGINNVPRVTNISLNVGESHTFITEEVINLGDPVRVYAAPNIATIDLSPMADKLAVVTVTNAYDKALGTRLTKLIIGNTSMPNLEVAEISGLKQATALEYLDVQGMKNMTSLDLGNHVYFKTLKAFGSSVSSVSFAKGAPVERLELPSEMRVLSLEELPYITFDNVVLEDKSNLAGIIIKDCPNISNDFDYIYDWYSIKNTDDSRCTLSLDNVAWENVDAHKLVQVLSIGNVSLRGYARVSSITQEDVDELYRILGDDAFDSNASFYVTAPDSIFLLGQDEIIEGDSIQFSNILFSDKEGRISYSISNGSRTGVSIDSSTGLLTSTITGANNSTLTIRATFVASDNSKAFYDEKSLLVKKAIYPANATIDGVTSLDGEYNVFKWSTTTANVNGRFYTEWILSGDITSCAEISGSNINECTLRSINEPESSVEGVLTLKLFKVYDDSVIITQTKTVVKLNSNILMTSTTNPEVMTCMVKAGFAANSTYMTKAEAAALSDSDIQSGTGYSTSIFYKYGSGMKYFPEFKYFNGLTKVPAYCFYGRSSLLSIELPPTITSIGTHAFDACQNLLEISIPPLVTTIDTYAFYGCYDLKTITIPESLEKINSEAFYNCYGMRRINISSVEHWCSIKFVNSRSIPQGDASCDLNFSGATQFINVPYLYMDGEPIKDLVIPDNVTNIPDYAFEMLGIDSVHIGKSVASIGASSFYYDRRLKRITGGENVTSIQKAAFGYIDLSATLGSSMSFGLFTSDVNSYAGITFSPASYIFGATTFTGQAGALFDDKTNKKTLILGYTGSVEDLTDRLSLIYRRIVINCDKKEAEFDVDYLDSSSYERVVTRVSGVGEHILPISNSTTIGEPIIGVTAVTKYAGYDNPSRGTVNISSNLATSTFNLEYTESFIVKIEHVNGDLYTLDEWKASGIGSSYANGVAVIGCMSKGFVISHNDIAGSGLKFGGYNKTLTIPTPYTTSEAAKKDFDGLNNTVKTIEQLTGYTNSSITGAPACEACVGYTFPDGSNGYLGAYGQLYTIGRYLDGINNCLSQVAGTKIDGYHWSSTNRGDRNYGLVRVMTDNSDYYYAYKNSVYKVRALAEYATLDISCNINSRFTLNYVDVLGNNVSKRVTDGMTELNIARGSVITITPDKFGDTQIEAQSFTWSQRRHNVTFTYSVGPGVYIQHIDGSLLTETEWTAAGYANDVANGVAILSTTAPGFVIAKADASSTTISWGGYSKLISDIVTINSTAAVRDLDGYGNTTKIIEQLAGYTDRSGIVGAPAAEACAAYVFPNGKKGYLPALGEWQAAYNNKTAVVSAMALIGGTAILTSYHWSSTQLSAEKAWYLHWSSGNLSSDAKKNGYYVRAFTSL